MTTASSRTLARLVAKRFRPSLVTVVLASVLSNLLMFGASLYLLVVYDLVLPSGSVATLLSLFAMLALVYAFQAFFDLIRGAALRSIAARLHEALGPRVRHAMNNRPRLKGKASVDGMQPMRDLDQIHAYLSGPGPGALIDLPWVVVFLGALTLLHPWLGVAGLAGVIGMAAIAWTSSRKTREEIEGLSATVAGRNLSLMTDLRIAESAVAMGMSQRLSDRATALEARYRSEQGRLAEIVGRYGGIGKVFRMFVQSLVLTAGALLVIGGEASAGIIIAASILAGRALAPVDTAVATWKAFEAARAGWGRTVAAIEEIRPAELRDVELELPSSRLSLEDVWIVPPGGDLPVVENISLELEAGQALAVIGPSGAGKSSLVRAILGIWKPVRGEVRLDGARLDQWDSCRLGSAMGYVPQTIEFVDGTIAQNVARFDPEAQSADVIAAVKKVGMHEVVLAMADGYDTSVSASGGELSAGQKQRLALARAVYGDPFLLVLDEANSNLDSEGDQALADVIEAHRKAGGIAVMVTHRPATLGPATHVAVMKDGRLVDFGNRDPVLKRTLAQPVKLAPVSGGAPA